VVPAMLGTGRRPSLQLTAFASSRQRDSSPQRLVPKLCLGTQLSRQLCCPRRETEFRRQGHSQTEFGNEGNSKQDAGGNGVNEVLALWGPILINGGLIAPRDLGMKAIAVVVIAARNGHVSSEAALGLAPSGPLQQMPVLNGEDNGVHPLARDQGSPPFWTWFIENPRRRSA
jgi:hypothetical protein